jgi:hypothetical protein
VTSTTFPARRSTIDGAVSSEAPRVRGFVGAVLRLEAREVFAAGFPGDVGRFEVVALRGGFSTTRQIMGHLPSGRQLPEEGLGSCGRPDGRG